MPEILIKFEMHISMYMNSFSRLYKKLQLTVVLPTSEDVHAKLTQKATFVVVKHFRFHSYRLQLTTTVRLYCEEGTILYYFIKPAFECQLVESMNSSFLAQSAYLGVARHYNLHSNTK